MADRAPSPRTSWQTDGGRATDRGGELQTSSDGNTDRLLVLEQAIESAEHYLIVDRLTAGIDTYDCGGSVMGRKKWSEGRSTVERRSQEGI